MKYLAHVWYAKSSQPEALIDVGDLAGAARLMSDFMINGWWRMDFFTDGRWSHRVQQNPTDDLDPRIVEVHDGNN